MANEATIINNPDSTPGAVSSGYQRQNTRFIAQANGIDRSVIVGGAGKVTVKVSGPVDVNGVLYTISTEVDLTITGGAGRYVVYLSGSGDALTPTLTDTAPEFDEEKNAHYTSGGYRVLNWLIDYDGTNVPTVRRFEDRCEDTWITSDAEDWTAMVSKVYEIWMVGKGGDGGDATSTDDTNTYGGGGGGGCAGVRKIFINAGDTWTSSFSSASQGDTQFSDGSTTLSVENGEDGVNATDGWTRGGYGGRAAQGLGMDEYFQGKMGACFYNNFGGDSIMGVGGAGGYPFLAGMNSVGQPGEEYGGGAGGGYRADAGTATGGSGGSAAIRIVG